MVQPFIGRQEEGENTLELPSHGRVADRGITPDIIESLIRRESSGKANAVGKANEKGLMQVTPIVAKQYGVDPAALSDPNVNRMVGTRYLNDLYKQFGSVPLALAAYNAGPTNVRRGVIPDSTKAYVREILEGVGSLASKAIGEGTAEGGGHYYSAKRKQWYADPEGKVPLPETAVPETKRVKVASIASPGKMPRPPIDTPAPGAPASEDWYSRDVAKPLTGAVTKGLSKIEPTALQNFRQPVKPFGIDLGTISGKPSDVAEFAVPQTKLDAALTGASLAMPALKGAKLLEPLLGSRLGRIATTTAIGAGEQMLEGKSPWGGAAKGALTSIPGEATSSALQRFTEGPEAARYTSKLGKTVEEQYPWIKRALGGRSLRSGADIDAAVKSGDLERGLVNVLNTEKANISRSLGGAPLRMSHALDALIRDNPDEAADMGVAMGQDVNFKKADEFLSKVRQKAYSLRSGDPKDQAMAARIRSNADNALDVMRQRLNGLKPGAGDAYRQAQKSYWEAKNVSDLLSEPGVIERGTIDPERMQALARERTNKTYRRELEATPAGKKVLSKTFRGGSPAATDRPRAEIPIRLHVPGAPLGSHLGIPLGTKRAGTVDQKLYGGLPYATWQRIFGNSNEEGQGQ